MTAGELRQRLTCGNRSCSCARPRGNVHCPNGAGHSNGDANPSLTVDRRGGRDLVHCKSGCRQGAVIDALRERGLWNKQTPSGRQRVRRGAVSETPTAPKPDPVGPWQFVREWSFVDPRTAEVLALHGRFERATVDVSVEKKFEWRLPDGRFRQGLQRRYKLEDLPLYNAHLLDQRHEAPVYLCEGEKAADACTSNGLLAVAPGGGAAQRQFGASLDALRVRDVLLWPDNDEPGRALMARIATILPRARLLDVPDLPLKGDAADYFGDPYGN